MSVENKYGISTANVLDTPTVDKALTWGISKHVEVAKASGIDGVELWPQGVKPLREIDNDTLSEEELSGILSAHQSPRDSLRSLRALKVALFLPHRDKSFDYLERIDAKAGGIPVVLYQETPVEVIRGSTIKNKQIQTDPAVCIAWDVNSASEYLDEVSRRGFTDESGNPGIVIDTHHIRHRDVETGQENPLADWKESIPILLPYTREIHLGVGRWDFGLVDHEKLEDELVDLLNDGENNTEVVQMLRLVAESGWNGLIIIEMRPSFVKKYIRSESNRKSKSFPEKYLGQMSEQDLIETYERIRSTLYNTSDK